MIIELFFQGEVCKGVRVVVVVVVVVTVVDLVKGELSFLLPHPTKFCHV